ncbi:MAG: DUF1266 domain-containing protein [Gammaproteobacteria bacterium]|nr:DUF1266 domain-containing protein [Gammaproteobacteria bacterium]
MKRLGECCAGEEAAYLGWRDGVQIATEEYRALANACWFLVNEGSVVDLSSIRRICSAPLACDIEQTAYLVRLGLSVGFLEREQALLVLRELSDRARGGFQSWEDYSLAALIGMAVRTRDELTDDEEWRHIARSHRVFLSGQQAAFSLAAGWSGRQAPAASAQAGEEELAPMSAAAS